MRFAWVGFHREGIPALEAVLEAGAPVLGVLTLRPDLAARRNAGADYRPVCTRYDVPLYYISNVNDLDAVQVLNRLAPDLVFAIGWNQVVRPQTLRLAALGWIGAHASLLPHNRGSAPINWALIRGERETGNTLLWLSDDVDTGQIIDQTAFPITPYDTCATLYEKVAASNREMLLRQLPDLLSGKRPGQPQPHSQEPPLPRRRPADGQIDWNRPSQEIYNLIRALTRPYPGAFGTLLGRRWLIWSAALPPTVRTLARPGTVLGPVVSSIPEACGQMVACGEGSIVALELEAQDGTPLRGRELADQPWTGERWLQD